MGQFFHTVCFIDIIKQFQKDTMNNRYEKEVISSEEDTDRFSDLPEK